MAGGRGQVDPGGPARDAREGTHHQAGPARHVEYRVVRVGAAGGSEERQGLLVPDPRRRGERDGLPGELVEDQVAM